MNATITALGNGTSTNAIPINIDGTAGYLLPGSTIQAPYANTITTAGGTYSGYERIQIIATESGGGYTAGTPGYEIALQGFVLGVSILAVSLYVRIAKILKAGSPDI